MILLVIIMGCFAQERIVDELKVRESGGLDKITIDAPAISSAYSLTLPTTQGSANECLGNSGTAGDLTFIACLTQAANQTLSNLTSPTAINQDLNLNSGSDLVFTETGGSDTATFTQGAMTGSVIYTLPPDDGDANEVLTTDGSGTLTWEPGGGGGSLTIGDSITSGTANRVLFEDTSNQLAEDAGLRYNETTDSLSVGANDPQANLHVNSGTSSTVEFQMTNTNTGNTDNTGFEIELLTDSTATIKNNSTDDINIMTNNTQRIEVDGSNPIVRIGRNDLSASAPRLTLYGASSGNDGSQIRLHTSADNDTNFEYFGLEVDQEDLKITDATNDLITIDGNDAKATFNDPSTTEGLIELNSNNGSVEISSGNDSFAFIDFKDAVADDFDARISWTIESSSDVVELNTDTARYTGNFHYDEVSGSVANTASLTSAGVSSSGHGMVMCSVDDLTNHCAAVWYTNTTTGITFHTIHTCTGVSFSSLSTPTRIVCTNNTGSTQTMYMTVQRFR